MELKDKINILPNLPGVYRFLDENGTVIYIGKAKNLKKRVSQYFVGEDKLSYKTKVLVSKIRGLEHTVVESEQDALLLENNLIKQYQPKYNILLKDGKSYPWICVKNEPFPRVFLTRRFVKDGSAYFGPYSSVQHAYHILDMINSIYKLRNCKNIFTKEAIENLKYKPCLNMHIKKCEAPCIGKISEEDYNTQILAIKNILRGKTSDLIKDYKSKMLLASSSMDFERAQDFKNKIEVLDNHYSKSIIVSSSISNVDVFSIVIEGYAGFGNFMRLSEGCIIQSLNLEFKLNIEEKQEDVLERFIIEVYSILGVEIDNLKNTEILVPFIPDNLKNIKNIHIPIKGDKASLMDLSLKNANAFKFHQLKQEEIKNPDELANKSVVALKDVLNMDKLPLHIECFDNSNTQGTNPVAACVVFKNGKPSKKDYRHFNIKTVIGANDFASMKEVLTRRYSRLVREGEKLPQLIVVDGGKGQLSLAMQALDELGLKDKIEIVGLAKRLEEIITPYDKDSLFLDKNSPALRLLMNLRDEAHRFGITHHRNKRTKAQVNSVLREIPGIGESTEQKLIKHFKSVKRVKQAPVNELIEIVGQKNAKAILKHFGLQT